MTNKGFCTMTRTKKTFSLILLILLAVNVFTASNTFSNIFDPDVAEVEDKFETVRYHMMKAKHYAEKSMYKTALVHLKKANKMDPQDRKIIHLIGRTYIKLGQYDKAISEYKHVLKYDHKNYRIYGELGQIYFAKKDFKTGIMYTEKSLEIKKGQLGVIKNLAKAYFNINDYDKSLEYIHMFERQFRYSNILKLPEKTLQQNEKYRLQIEDLKSIITSSKSTNEIHSYLFKDLGYGFLSSETGYKANAPQSSLGTINVAKHSLGSQTDQISATIGTLFGVVFELTDAKRSDNNGVLLLTYKVIHPQTINPSSNMISTVDEWSSPVKLGKKSSVGWKFEHDWELVSGEWEIQVWAKDEKLYSKTFYVTKK